MRFLSIMSILLASPCFAGIITTYSGRSTFNAVVGPVTVEDFTDTHHFPINPAVLNSQTNQPAIGIVPGTIKPGVTYSAGIPITGSGNEFNIDAGGGFTGGFLDSLVSGGRRIPLNVTFDAPVGAFGFDTNTIGGPTLDVVIRFTNGPDYVTSLPVADAAFFGFLSTAPDIEGATISGNNPSFGFALDNFTFAQQAAVPEPSSFGLAGIALATLAYAARKVRP